VLGELVWISRSHVQQNFHHMVFKLGRQPYSFIVIIIIVIIIIIIIIIVITHRLLPPIAPWPHAASGCGLGVFGCADRPASAPAARAIACVSRTASSAAWDRILVAMHHAKPARGGNFGPHLIHQTFDLAPRFCFSVPVAMPVSVPSTSEESALDVGPFRHG
jgi:hypothetical protein